MSPKISQDQMDFEDRLNLKAYKNELFTPKSCINIEKISTNNEKSIISSLLAIRRIKIKD